MDISFFSRLTQLANARNSLLCAGLDPHPDQLPQQSAAAARDFCLHLVEQTHPYVIAYKPNIAFFEMYGTAGIEALLDVKQAIPAEIPVVLDAKRGDIGSTSKAYAQAVFQTLGADCVTANAYLGYDAIQPFIQDSQKGIFILCKTSNPSSVELQDIPLVTGQTVCHHLACLAQSWNSRDNIGLVIGATHPQTLAEMRQAVPEMWFLTPGIGAQGGDLPAALQAGLRQDGLGMLVSVSRAISQAAEPAQAAKTLRDEINNCRVNRPQQKLNYRLEKLAAGLLELGCVKFGEFTLKSGKSSPIYIDLRRLSGNPQMLFQVARAYSDIISRLPAQRLAGLPYAAIPVATAISLQTGIPLIYPRKETKEYGMKAAIEGPYESGEQVVVVDDLVTTGLSKFEAIEKLVEAGLLVQDIVVLINRLACNDRVFEEKGLALHSVFTLSELMVIWQSMGKITGEQRQLVEDYLNQA